MKYGLESIIRFFENGISLPQQLLSSGEFKVLHISDTPSPIYHAINSMLVQLKPDMIVHTGDIADEIKLGDNPGFLEQYGRTAGPFIKNLSQSTAKLYIIPGNHDSIPLIESNAPPGSLISPGSVIDVRGHAFGMAHYLTDLPEGAEYNLYGHNLDTPEMQGDACLLNGVTSINVILLPSGKTFRLRYPYGTNRYRKYKENPPTLI